MTITLVSLNVSLFDENNEKLHAFLKKLQPDIVCLQEVAEKIDPTVTDTLVSKTAIDDATPQLSHAVFSPIWSLKDFRQPDFHGKEDFYVDFGGTVEYGNYIKTAFKVIHQENIFVQGAFSHMQDWQYMKAHPGEEPRAVQVVDIELPSLQKLRILNYHGIWSKDKKGSKSTERVSKLLCEIAARVTFPAVLCGDFNLFPETSSIRMLDSYFTNVGNMYNISRTRPTSNELSHVKRNVVDYIFVSKGITIKGFTVIENDVSDHFPLVLQCTLPLES